MITAVCELEPYAVRFSDGRHAALADASTDDGGRSAGFKPHALLEAALATCIAMTIRIYADRHAIALPGLGARAKFDVSNPTRPVLRYDVDFGTAPLDADIRARLLRAAAGCPVHKTLSSAFALERSELVV